MARRRYRKTTRRKGYRRRFRRRTGKLRRIVVSLSRKIAGEVKKMDNNQLVSQASFQQLTPQSSSSLADYGLLYQVFGNNGAVQGYELDDFIGEQIRAKYLYLGVHLQSVTTNYYDASTNALNSLNLPLSMRVMVVQDRNYNNTASAQSGVAQVINVASMVQNLFGVGYTQTSLGAYNSAADFTLLPINPMEPGRFNVIRDFRMSVAPGYRNDYYKKLMMFQKDLNSKGRIYFGDTTSAIEQPPGDEPSVRTISRNNIYVLFLFQTPAQIGSTATATPPQFNLSIQTRFAYYDN